MKTLRKYISEINGLRFLYDKLKLNSSVSRRVLLDQEFLTDSKLIGREISNLSKTIEYISLEKNYKSVDFLSHKLSELNDIKSTISNLSNNNNLDDIELFEIKKFSLISQDIMSKCMSSNFNVSSLHNLADVIEILDPENTKIPSFYIYSAYDSKLKELRSLQKSFGDDKSKKAEKIRQDCIELEDEIRKKITLSLMKFASDLQDNLEQLAYLDILLAKANQAKEFGFCKPQISTVKTEYKELFNPQVKEVLASQSKMFQNVNVSFANKPNLITGANMSGKTVLLKSIALSQYLFQFGFYVPASYANIVPVQEVLMSVGDNQSELNGLSSFAVEMLNINSIIEKARKGIRVLALVDELARTTNPDEGKAIVNAFVEIMTDLEVPSLITTHYGGVAKNCRKLRVKGLVIDENTEKITVDNINDFMDYSLIETTSSDVPMEAIRIAEILEIDKEFVDKAKGQRGATV